VGGNRASDERRTAMERTILSAAISAANLCALARALTNHVGSDAKDGLVYLHTDSLGGRKVSLTENVWSGVFEARASADHTALDGEFGAWYGFDPATAEGFWWSSASGASLQADRIEGGWRLTYASPELEDRESSYLDHFVRAAELEILEVSQLHLSRAEDHLLFLAGRTEDAERALRFLEILRASVGA
jgi:hypothetical protein